MTVPSGPPPADLVPAPAAIPRPDEAELRPVIEELADIDRAPASPGEREAAHVIAGRFQGLGLRVEVEDEPAFGSYAWPVGAASAVAAAAGLVARHTAQCTDPTRRGSRYGSALRRAAGTLGGALGAAGIADEISLGRQVIRRLISPRRTTCNVVGYAGDQDAERTLVVMAHHDAAPSGIVFDQRLERWLAARYPDVVARMTENPPLWWPVVAGPALVAIGSAPLPLPPTISRAIRATGTVMSAAAAAAFIDIGLRGPVPGANDNLSGVAVLVWLARALSKRSTEGLRVILFSAGAEEALQQGARAFARRHFPALPRERTSFLNLDTVGSGRLVLLDGEGPIRMERYHTGMSDLVARCADELGIFLHRRLRSRNSTDGVVPMRAGYPAATLASVDDAKLLPHYHLYSDIPENVDYRCVADAAQLTEAVVRAGGMPLA